MVGDFQQSIYWQRADLNYYRAVHEALISDKNGESLEFAVTFRLDQKQLDFVNETFREILNNKDGQVRFVELQPRPNILPGKVIRVPLVAKELLPEGKRFKDYQKARIEAEYLARWIKDAGLKKLSADSWREVAILCPRKAWLQTTAAALRRVGLPMAIQSERDVKGDSPAYAWLTALLTIMVDPLGLGLAFLAACSQVVFIAVSRSGYRAIPTLQAMTAILFGDALAFAMERLSLPPLPIWLPPTMPPASPSRPIRWRSSSP